MTYFQSLSDMERQDYIDQINDLKSTVRRLLDMTDSLKQALDTVSASNRRNEELVKSLTSQIESLQKTIRDLTDRNNLRGVDPADGGCQKKSKS